MAAEDFIITRKRKKYRFAKFAEASNCYELADWQPLETNKSLTIEVGAGTGLFSVELAARHPDELFIAMDVKADRLQKGAYTALEKGLTNIYFVRAHVFHLQEICRSGSVAAIWVTFPDPYPRLRSAKRRLLHSHFLQLYRKILSSAGKLYFKTDNHPLFDWGAEQLVAEGWRIDQLTYDLHASPLAEDTKIMTTFETRFIAEQLPILYLRAGRK